MPKLKEKNDQHLPKSSSYVNILQLVPDKLDESHPAPPGWVDGGNWWVVTWLLTSDWW